MRNERRYLTLGFHGCEKDIAIKILLHRQMFNQSNNSYDWLGTGVYFWENDPLRAFEFARDIKRCKDPFVLGTILDLGYCLDLTCRNNIQQLAATWNTIVKPIYESGNLKENKPGKRGENGELMLRFLDRYVIETLHEFNRERGYEQYDSVRAGFWEGDELYPTAGFREKNHIQICIRNMECILGAFLPEGYSL